MYLVSKNFNIQIFANKFFLYDGIYHQRSFGLYFYGYEITFWYETGKWLNLRLKSPNKEKWIKLLKF